MNTHYGVIYSSVPPEMEVVASGPYEFCRAALNAWIDGHPLGEYERGEVLAREADMVAAERVELATRASLDALSQFRTVRVEDDNNQGETE